MSDYVEVLREEDTGHESRRVKCVVCGREFWLHFNGGELDGRDCCGHRYELEHVRIDYVVSRRAEGDGAPPTENQSR